MKNYRDRFTLDKKYDAAVHTFEDLTDAVETLYQETATDMMATMSRREANNYSKKSGAFRDLAGDRMHDAGVPTEMIRKVQAWCRKTP